MKTSTLSTLLLAGLAAAAPTAKRAEKQAAAIIAAIMPTADSCAGADFPDECRTASQAAPHLIAAMQAYGVYSPGAVSAVLALVGYESVDMKYKHNVSPGREGQGTSNMQMAAFNIEYGQSIPAIGDRAAAAGAAGILALVTDDKYNFGSGPWFLRNKCDADVLTGLAAFTDEAFAAYMACVGVTVDEGRQAYWDRAKTAWQ
ncbi:hypothetical protein UCRPA7_7666 [Phaeoacremonium minimum UCRPA7]|uniref:Uncharacterized protein n=1 Tax=Phaeoacremonium minimum (strain UCR-PA7) TaxID=1286976 RepID=R8BC88_PHAM7|nr:hypothetical protein UCRPA7_7666 [Phaeoacremonium minimum UCRPA7]EON96913.1 hypothetical protein UCRPA7_7666 [Phaeoacremonium minimum UCRPA7]